MDVKVLMDDALGVRVNGHYDSVREAGKLLLPLVKLYFLAPTEEE
jgi:hypothetical protein